MAGVLRQAPNAVFVNLDHQKFGAGINLVRGIAHESAHAVGLRHGSVGSHDAYYDGGPQQRAAYDALSKVDPGAAMANPDHLVKAGGLR